MNTEDPRMTGVDAAVDRVARYVLGTIQCDLHVHPGQSYDDLDPTAREALRVVARPLAEAALGIAGDAS
jgi:hypothetical protein